LGEAVDHLMATYTMPIQTLVAAMTDEYLSATGSDEVDEVECAECGHVFELDEEQTKALDEAEAGDAVELECPKCRETFELPADDAVDEP
jgi:phage FluMu protein Com